MKLFLYALWRSVSAVIAYLADSHFVSLLSRFYQHSQCTLYCLNLRNVSAAAVSYLLCYVINRSSETNPFSFKTLAHTATITFRSL